MKTQPSTWRVVAVLAVLAGALLATTGSKSNCIPVEPEPTDCATNADCLDEADYCARAEGACDAVGVCEARPIACPHLWDPVCGCDGATYGNACEAAAAGVSVAAGGECAPPPTTCETDQDCWFASGTAHGWDTIYCAREPGDCEGPGTCATTPELCPDIWDPVCGCDGATYGNACEAAGAGVNVAYEGACAATR